MNDDFKKAVEILVSNHYLVPIDGTLIITNKFTRELAEVKPADLFQKPTPSELPDIAAPIGRILREVVKVDSKTKTVIPRAGEDSPLTKFIMECEVPTRIRGGDGKFYWANKYSKEAEKELAIILHNSYQYDVLVASTRLYYKGGGMVEAISNYIVRGTWLAHYQDMEKALKGGNVQKHIQDNVKDDTQKGDMYDDR